MAKEILLGKRSKKCLGLVAVVDDSDLGLAMQYPWHWDGFYVRYRKKMSGKNSVLYLHRHLLNAPADKLVDHIDGNTLNNRRDNLRLCDDIGNGRNVTKRRFGCLSQYKGVTFHRGIWRARITVSGATIELGYYNCEVDAAFAYDQAAMEHHGFFAKLNFAKVA